MQVSATKGEKIATSHKLGNVSSNSKLDCTAFLKKINKFVKNHFVEFLALAGAGAICYMDPTKFAIWFVVGVGGALAADKLQQYAEKKLKEQNEAESPEESEEAKLAKTQAEWKSYYKQKTFHITLSVVAIYYDFHAHFFSVGAAVGAGNMAYWKVKEYMSPTPQ